MEYSGEGNETERKFYLRVARLVDKRFEAFRQNANSRYEAFLNKQLRWKESHLSWAAVNLWTQLRDLLGPRQ